jgi:hypothetical protein
MVASSLRYHGDLPAARRLLSRASDPDSPALTPARIMIALFDRDFTGALKIIRSVNIPVPSIRAQLDGFTATIEAQQKRSESERRGARERRAQTRDVASRCPR